MAVHKLSHVLGSLKFEWINQSIKEMIVSKKL